MNLTVFNAGRRVADRLPRAAIPQHHRAAAVLAGRDDALEIAVIERMIFDLRGEPLVLRVKARPLRDCPALQDAVAFEAEALACWRASGIAG